MKKKTCHAHHGGFTLIELAISLVFIGILSITVVLLIRSVTTSYQRGLILNQLNTVGMDLTDDMRTSVQNASSYSILEMCNTFYTEGTANRDSCISDNANSFVSVVKRASVTTKDGVIGDNMPVYGAFCTGTYTYIWNSGYFEKAEYDEKRAVTSTGGELSPVSLGVRNPDTGTVSTLKSNFRLLKIYDTERTVCVNAMKTQIGSLDDKIENYRALSNYNNDKIQTQFVIDSAMISADPDGEGGVELMSINGLNDLVIYDLYVAKPAISSTRKNFFYSASFILGTKRGGINIKRAGDSCKPPSDDFSELEYCAINKFNFAVQAGGE